MTYRRFSLRALLCSGALFVALTTLQAGSATWSASPSSGDWNSATNWTPMTVPNGPSDIATFDVSTIRSLSISAATEVNEINFTLGTTNYSFTVNAPAVLTIDAGGVLNPSGVAQSFFVQPGASLLLQDSDATQDNVTYEALGAADSSTAPGYLALLSANAGTSNYVLDGGRSGSALGAYMQFHEASTSGNSFFTINGGSAPFAFGALLEFGGTDSFPSAGNGQYTITGASAEGAHGGFVDVLFGTTLETATFNVFGGYVAGPTNGTLHVSSGATADRATLIGVGGGAGAEAGTIIFDHDSSGGTSTVNLTGKASLDISSHDDPGLTIGSLEGKGGMVFLGSHNLTVNSVKRSAVFAGSLRDGGPGAGTGGSFTKTGPGTLSLTGASTYTGGTTISLGIVLVNNTRGTATGTGSVMVSRARLGGDGIIAGHVSVGNGGALAVLGAGNPVPNGDLIGHLTVQSSVFFSNSAAYEAQINTDTVEADLLTANRVTISSGAIFTTDDLGTSTLTSGTVLTIISNTSALPIKGTFSNLPDHSITQIDGKNYEVNYEGGDGNDLTLTAMP